MFTLPDLSKYFKYGNIFSFLYRKYFQGYYMTTLQTNYEMTINKAEASGDSLSWWDVFDGMMWIITIVFGMIAAGYIKAIL